MRNRKLTLIKSNLRSDGEILIVTKLKKTVKRKNKLLLSDNGKNYFGYKAIANNTEEDLNEGDIVRVFPGGECTILWKCNSIHNSLFTTSACNVRCIMCPQPPQKDDPAIHKQNITILKFIRKNPEVVCISGGEPILFPERLIKYFEIINKKFPSCEVDILTNATKLSKFDIAKEIALKAPLKTTFCVSLHSDVADIHESINGRKGSFNDAIKGITNLGKLNQSIEIRPVITKLNYEYINDFSIFVYRNFPFVRHIAFMGQEIIGYARNNFNDIWIDPIEYTERLSESVKFLDSIGMNVSIYNIPLCLLPQDARKFARRSISDWKQGYLKECTLCTKRNECCGIFLTSDGNQSKGISPILGT